MIEIRAESFNKPLKIDKISSPNIVYVRESIEEINIGDMVKYSYIEKQYSSEEYKLIELEQIQKEQDKILLKQDLKLMCLDVPVPVFLDNLDNSIDKNSYNLLFRIIDNKNYRDKSEFINIIEFYHQKNKISDDNKNNLIKLINSK